MFIVADFKIGFTVHSLFRELSYLMQNSRKHPDK